jgi:hypothetical protein
MKRENFYIIHTEREIHFSTVGKNMKSKGNGWVGSGYGSMAAAQKLCASTFIAALRHSEVKFGLTLCIWRSVSAQIRIIIQLFIITALAAL